MKSPIFTSFVTIVFYLIASPIYSQPEDCRLKPEDMKPLIQRYNPFFSNHTWNAASQIEMARMGEDRLILITQEGCIRHHITFTLIIDPEVVKPNREFWMNEVRSFMHNVHWEQPEYSTFGADFETVFANRFSTHGLNDSFNFPIGSRNFICELIFDPEKGGKITIEMVNFIFKEKLDNKRLAAPSENDDGWLGTEKKP
ncbi:MAG: hypothetical protein SF052_18495 [Bacteroidia bacterium]|nr:hypothetical protein [Bacteroidia bacterium]